MSDRATLHVLVGKAGSGKTTLARTIAREHSAVFICEDEWLSKLADTITSLADYVKSSRRCRSVIGPHVVALLRLGVSVVFDFAGNTERDRAWVRGIAEEAAADVVLHSIVASDETCKARIRERNRTRPEGIFWGEVSEELFDAVTKYFAPPQESEGFQVVTYGV